MTNNLKRLLADADALTIDARRIDRLGRELNDKRAEIIDGLCELGIRVTAARAMVAKIECTVTLPEGAEAIDAEPDADAVDQYNRMQNVPVKTPTDEMPPIPAGPRRA